MIEIDMAFEELGIRIGDWSAGLFNGTAHCIATDDDEIVVVDISLDVSKLNDKRTGYDTESRMLDRSDVDQRVLFHQLTKALYATHQNALDEAAVEAGWKPHSDWPYPSNQAGRTL